MQKLSIGAVILSVLLFTPPAFAQTTDYHGSGTAGSYCPKLSITMERGARDAQYSNQVSELQKFLSDYYDIDPDELVTGYFGPITQGHVQKFQKWQGLPTFGIAGSLTRAAIAKVCASVSSNPTTPAKPSTSPTPTATTSPVLSPTFSATPTAGPAPLAVAFATNVSGSGYYIDFGDGSTAWIGNTPSSVTGAGGYCANGACSYTTNHTYSTAGTFSAVLKNATASFIGVTVTIGSPNLSNKPSCTISASSNSITPGQPFTLLWSSQNSTNATLAPADGPVGISGSKQLSLGNSGTLNMSTYTLTVTGPTGSTQCSTTVTAGFPGAPTGSIDPSSLTSTGQVTITGVAANSAAVFVALVNPSYNGSIEWRTMYTNHSYVTFSDKGVYPVTNNKWSVPLGTVAAGTYKVLVYDDSTIQQILAQGTLTVNAPQSY